MDDHERRITILEEGFKRFSADMATLLSETQALRVDVAEVKGRVGALPSTIQLLGFAVAVFVAAGIFRAIWH